MNSKAGYWPVCISYPPSVHLNLHGIGEENEVPPESPAADCISLVRKGSSLSTILQNDAHISSEKQNRIHIFTQPPFPRLPPTPPWPPPPPSPSPQSVPSAPPRQRDLPSVGCLLSVLQTSQTSALKFEPQSSTPDFCGTVGCILCVHFCLCNIFFPKAKTILLFQC